jgi:hypothetical protein
MLSFQEDLIFEDIDETLDDELQKISFSKLSNDIRAHSTRQQCNKVLFFFF